VIELELMGSMGNLGKPGRKFKKVCPSYDCTGCNSLNYVHKLHRWCYEENYGLKTIKHERHLINGKVSNVMTNFAAIHPKPREIITGHETDSHTWEENLTSINELAVKERFDETAEA